MSSAASRCWYSASSSTASASSATPSCLDSIPRVVAGSWSRASTTSVPGFTRTRAASSSKRSCLPPRAGFLAILRTVEVDRSLRGAGVPGPRRADGRRACDDPPVTVAGGSRAAEGFEALARADWTAARAALEAAVAEGDESPEVLDALGRAAWWLRDAEAAVVARERAYAGFRRAGDLARAARIALWLSREYALVWRNAAASDGWLARAERLLADAAPGAERVGSTSPARRRPPIPTRPRRSRAERSTPRWRPATRISSCARSPSSARRRSRPASSTRACVASTRRWRRRRAGRRRRSRRSPRSAAR